MPNSETARNVLFAQLVVSVLVVVAQIVSLVTVGATTRYPAQMVSLAVTSIVCTLAALAAVSRYTFVAVQFAAWYNFAVVIGMTVIDCVSGKHDYPILFSFLLFGVFALNWVVGFIEALPFSATVLLTIFATGIIYDKCDAAVVTCILTLMAVMSGASSFKDRRELNLLQIAIRTYKNAKSKKRRP